METVMLSAGTLSKFILIKPDDNVNKGYVYYDNDGSVRIGEENVLSEMVKIEAERAKINDRYVHLRICHSNRYWECKGIRLSIVAESNKPEEDTRKPSCTLFEAVSVAGGNGQFYLNHVQSGGRVLIDSSSKGLFVYLNPSPDDGKLNFLDWETLVKLPRRVAFKGNNGKFLQAVWWDSHPYLQFAADDPNVLNTGYVITSLPDGRVRIWSNNFSKYWRRDDIIVSSGWIWADSDDTTANNRSTIFWPVKIDDNTIALRNESNEYFCKSLTADNKNDCLDAAAPTTSNETKLVVQELVSDRRIYNVRYRMEDSRIFNETPFVAGTTTGTNNSDVEAAIGVEVTYEDSKSYSFSRSLSLTAGVTSTIEFGVPLIEKGSITVSFEISTTLEWNNTTTTTTSVTATGSVTVPPRSIASISYVATMGTCDVPFSYTQKDKSSTDGTFAETEQIDGVFRGVNAYNFSFIIDKIQPL